MNKNVYCWNMDDNTRTQIGEKTILCYFHVMKAWSKNLLDRTLPCNKNLVWQTLYILILCPNEDYFDKNYKIFCQKI